MKVYNMTSKTGREIANQFVIEHEGNDFQFALYMYGANSTTVNVLRHKLTTIGEKEILIKKLIKEMELI